MSYLGDVRLGVTVDFKFTTRQISGAPFTLAGTPVVSAYVDNGTTQITAGITLTVDFDGVTGLNNVRVVLTSGNGYAAGTNIEFVITTGTVNSVSVVGEVVGTISIENRSALMPTTAGRTLDVSAGGEAGVDWANIGSPTTAQNLSGTNIDPDQVVASVTGAVGSVTGAVGSVSAGGIANASFAANAISAAKIDPDVATEISAPVVALLPAALVGGRMDSSIGAMAAGVLTNAAIADNAINDAKVDPDVTIASVTGAVGSVTGNVGGNVAGSVGSVGAGGIAAASFAAGAVDAAALAADAATEIANAVKAIQLVESYAAVGVAPTMQQAIMAILQKLFERSVAGTTETINGLDGVTPVMTETLNDAATPTAVTRAT